MPDPLADPGFRANRFPEAIMRRTSALDFAALFG